MIKKILYKLGDSNISRKLLEKNYLGFFPSRLHNYALIPYFLENENYNFQEVLLLDIIQQVFDDKVFNKKTLEPLLINNLIESLIVSRDINKKFNEVSKNKSVDFEIVDDFIKDPKSKFINEELVNKSDFLNNTDKWNIFKVSVKNIEKYNNYLEKIRNRTIDLLLDLEESKRNEDLYVEEGSEIFISFLKDYSKLIKEKRSAFEKIFFQDFEGKKTYLKEFNKEEVITAVFGFAHVSNLNLVKDKLEKINEYISEDLYQGLAKKTIQNFNFVVLNEFFLDYINSGGIIDSIDNIINNKTSVDLVKKQFEIANKVEEIYTNDSVHLSNYQERIEFFIEEVSNLFLSDKDLSFKYIDQIKEILDKQIETIKDKINKGHIHKNLLYTVFIDSVDKDLNLKLREISLLKTMDVSEDITKSKEVGKKVKI